jgi:transcriptional regulator with XRE-family HTH domain
MNYAKAIKVLRAAHGLRQCDLAEKAHVDKSYLSIIEGGRRRPSIRMIETLSKVLGVPVFLFMLFASEDRDLRGVDVRHVRALGDEVLAGLAVGRKGAAS